jgi:hypothetical protein
VISAITGNMEDSSAVDEGFRPRHGSEKVLSRPGPTRIATSVEDAEDSVEDFKAAA